jgi:hypothetical protein
MAKIARHPMSQFLSLPAALVTQMAEHPDVDWESIAVYAIQEELAERNMFRNLTTAEKRDICRMIEELVGPQIERNAKILKALKDGGPLSFT